MNGTLDVLDGGNATSAHKDSEAIDSGSSAALTVTSNIDGGGANG